MPRRRARYLLRNRLYILTVLLIGLCFSVVGLADDNATIHVALADKGHPIGGIAPATVELGKEALPT